MSGRARPRRTHGLWLAVGVSLVLGLAGGLVLTWEVWPVEYYDTDPMDLRADLKQEYLLLISSSFALDSDFDLARRRLAWLGFSEGEASRALANLAGRYMRLSADVTLVRSLSRLAYALGARDSQLLVFIDTPTPTITLTPTATATSTDTPMPSPTPLLMLSPTLVSWPTLTGTPVPERVPPATGVSSAAPVLRYQVEDRRFVCRPVAGLSSGKGLLEVRVRETDGRPLPGVSLLVRWGNDEDRFFTGLKPDRGLDYADFEMQPGLEYSLNVDENGSQPVKISFRDEDCITDVMTVTVPVWEVVFERVSSPGSTG